MTVHFIGAGPGAADLITVRGRELIRIAMSRADTLGEKTGWRAAMPVTQWSWTKP